MISKLNNISILPIICSCLILSACFGQFIDNREVMRSWVGKHIDDVILAWGYPDEERFVAGRKLIYWKSERVVKDYAYEDSYITINTKDPKKERIHKRTIANPAAAYVATCRKGFEVDQNGRILGWDIKGDDCSMYEHISIANPVSELVQNYKLKKQRPSNETYPPEK